MNIEEERKEIIDRIKSENDLIHQRMTWLGTFQGLLFGAVAFAWGKSNARPFVFVGCFVGMFVTISIAYAIHRANVGIDRATNRWDEIRPKEWKGLDSEGYRSSSGIAWLMPGVFIPWIFFGTWMILFDLVVNRY